MKDKNILGQERGTKNACKYFYLLYICECSGKFQVFLYVPISWIWEFAKVQLCPKDNNDKCVKKTLKHVLPRAFPWQHCRLTMFWYFGLSLSVVQCKYRHTYYINLLAGIYFSDFVLDRLSPELCLLHKMKANLG